MDDTFDQYRLEIDPTSKTVSAPQFSTNHEFQQELQSLNETHRHLTKDLEPGHAVPPPPQAVSIKRTQMIQKMKEQGNAAVSKKAANPQAAQQQYAEAVKCYTIALEMSLKRPAWEQSQIVRDECSILYSNRAQAHLALQNWPEAAVDAETSIELKAAPGQGKAWWRKTKALMEMGRWDEAETWCARGLGIEPAGDTANELKQLHDEIQEAMKRRTASRGA